MDRLAAIRVFVHVVETGSFSAAAVRLGLSRAAASKYVSQLEAHLGGRLLHRTTRHVSLTESGRLYFERCREILHNLEEADGVVSGLSQEPRGVLRLSAPTNFASLHLAKLVTRFMQTYPAVKVEMMCSDRHVDLVDEGYDMAIRISDQDNSELIARYLTHCRHVVVASPDYLSRHPAPKTPEDLRRHSCLLFAHTTGGIWPFAKDGQDYSIKVKQVFKSNNPDLLVETAIAGMGIAMLPTFITSEPIRRGALNILLTDYELPVMPVYAVYVSRQFLPAKTRVFIDYLKAYLHDPPYWDKVLGDYN